MAAEIKMPQLSDTMYSGKILTWHKKEGDQISRGDILAEVETDKANLEIESFQQGTLLQIKIPAGTSANVGDVIAVVGAPGEKVEASNGAKPAAEDKSEAPAQASQTQIQPRTEASTGNLQLVPPKAAQPAPPASHSDRVKASPLARKIAEQRNIELSNVQGSGPNGRIIKKDLDRAAAPAGEAEPSYTPSPPRAAPSPAAGGSAGSLTPLSKMRETIARRMQESVTQSPHFYVSTSVDMTQAKKLREALKERSEYKGISINHLVIKAVAYGIEKEPRVNNAVKENQLFEPAQINIGVITAIEDGLLIPVIKEANTLSLKDVVFEARAAVERARAGRPNASDLTGGTFSISNMGMFDVESFTAIINPGQGSVLAVSSIKEQPVAVNGQVLIAPIMKVTISVDHRIIDGVMAGNFLKYFKEALETPALLMV
ncbi:MAG: 2-oxo acid dehydrogenase subunit E2 [Deltaproteobacteria bacterium]|nr:2-oxo acid dehydrogenase subunit E2 [Deltaproteobacteria bacterium]